MAIDGNNSSVEGGIFFSSDCDKQMRLRLHWIIRAPSVAENQAQGTIVGTFQAQDPDGDALTYPSDQWIGDETIQCLSWRRTALCGQRWSLIMNHTQTLSIRVKAMDGNNSLLRCFHRSSNGYRETTPNQTPVGLGHFTSNRGRE